VFLGSKKTRWMMYSRDSRFPTGECASVTTYSNNNDRALSVWAINREVFISSSAFRSRSSSYYTSRKNRDNSLKWINLLIARRTSRIILLCYPLLLPPTPAAYTITTSRFEAAAFSRFRGARAKGVSIFFLHNIILYSAVNFMCNTRVVL